MRVYVSVCVCVCVCVCPQVCVCGKRRGRVYLRGLHPEEMPFLAAGGSVLAVGVPSSACCLATSKLIQPLINSFTCFSFFSSKLPTVFKPCIRGSQARRLHVTGPFLQSLTLSHAVYTDGSTAPRLPPLSSQGWDDFKPPLRL